ncbi:MAG: hypothetical protein AAF726_14330 [Planctomycetota bacterium]
MLALASLGLSVSPAAFPLQEPDLFVLARFDRIMKVSGYDGPNPTTEVVFSYARPPGSEGIPRGLEIDRATGDFLVLMSPIPNGFATEEAQILRIDRQSGQTVSTLALPLFNLDGFEQRYDGELFTVDSGRDLVRIDLATGTFTSIPLSQPISELYLGLTVDESSRLLASSFDPADSNLYAIDPVDGEVSVVDTLESSTMGLESNGDGQLCYGGLSFSLGIRIFDRATGMSTMIPGTQGTSNVYALQFEEPVDGDGVHPICDGLANSTGEGATLEVLGTADIARNDLTLYSRRLPTQSFGYFVMGPNAGFQPVGSGLLCVGAPQARYSLFLLNSGTSGTVRFDIDLFSLPNGGAPVAGRTEIFQFWFRDVGGTSNLSNALAVTLR